MLQPVICIGAALVDDLFHATEPMLMHTTNEVTVTRSAGGVSRNIAQQLCLLDVPVYLISVFGDDSDGNWLKQVCTDSGIKLDASITTTEIPTGKYTAIINPDGSMFTALKTNPSEQLISPDYLETQKALLQSAKFILADANLSRETIGWLIRFSNEHKVPLIIEPVSVPPAKKLASMDLRGLFLITPNEDELPVICSEKATTIEEQIEELRQRGVQNIWLHRGAAGSSFYNEEGLLKLGAPKVDVKECTGAGDGSVTGFILSKYLGKNNIESLQTAHTLAAEILQVNGAIASHLNREKLLSLVSKYYSE